MACNGLHMPHSTNSSSNSLHPTNKRQALRYKTVCHLAGASRPQVNFLTTEEKPATVVAPQQTQKLVNSKDFFKMHDLGFSFNHEEQKSGVWMRCTSGSVPKDLQGTYFRNGPGRFSVGDQKIGHAHDGDGLLVSVAFQEGRAFFKSSFVQTVEYKVEQEHQTKSVMFRGAFSTCRPGGQLANALNAYIKNTSNTLVMHWADELITTQPVGLPYATDPATLTTKGLETLSGAMRPGIPHDLGSEFANKMFGAFQSLMGHNRHLPREMLNGGGCVVPAHMHVDQVKQRLCLWNWQSVPAKNAVSPTDTDTRITFFEVDEHKQVAARKEYLMPGCGMLMDDFAVTDNYYIMLQPPVEVKGHKDFLLGKAGAVAAMVYNPQGVSLLHVIPRPGSEAEKRGEQPCVYPQESASFVIHITNAFEQDDSTLIIDAIHYPQKPAIIQPIDKKKEEQDKDQIEPDMRVFGRPMRMTLDKSSGAMSRRTLWQGHMEQPCIHEARRGKPYQFVYSCNIQTDNMCTGLAKVDVLSGQAQQYTPQRNYVCLEPCFVPRANMQSEDDGWLLCMGFNAAACSSELLIFDAKDIARGPVAKLAAPVPVPHGLHGTFTNKYYGPDN